MSTYRVLTTPSLGASGQNPGSTWVPTHKTGGIATTTVKVSSR